MNRKINLDKIFNKNRSPLYNSILVLILLVTIVVVLGIIFGGLSLVVWGLGNAIIWIFNLSATWSFLQSLVTVLVLWGIKMLLKWILGDK